MTELPSQLADAIADRIGIDWTEAKVRTTQEDVGIVRNLEEIATLAEVNRVPTGAPTLEGAQIPGWLIGFTVLAGAIVALAALNTLAVLVLTRLTVYAFQLATVALYGVTGAILLRIGSLDVRSRSYGAICTLIAAAFARPLLLLTPGITPLVNLSHLCSGISPEVMLPAAWWQFAQRFPHTEPLTRLDRAARNALRLSTGFGIAAFVATYLTASSESAAHNVWLSPFVRSSPYGAFWLTFYGLTASAVACIAARCAAAETAERNRVLLFGLALLAGTLPIMVAGILQVQSSWYRSADSAGHWVPRLIDTFVWLGLMSIPLSTGAAVAYRRALPVRHLALESAKFLLARNSIKVMAASLLVIVGAHVVRQRQQPLAESLSWVASYPLFVAVLLFLLWIGHRWVSRTVETMLGYAPVDYDRGVVDALEMVTAGNDRVSAGVLMTSALQRLYRGSRVHAFAMDDGTGWRALDPSSSAPFPSLSALPSLASGVRQGIRVGPGSVAFDLLTAADQHWVLRSGVAVLFSVGSPPWLVVGISPAGDYLPFTARDRQLLATLAGAVWHAPASRVVDASGSPALECTECGAVFERSLPPCECGAQTGLALLPKCLNKKFELIRRAGAGGMGTVYQATDLLIGRSVALKVVHVRDGSNTSAILREARAMAAARHEHLAQIHAVELHLDTPVLVVEWMPRGTLDTLLASGVLSWRRALTLGAGIADALSHLHGIGVLHRDVKPSNIGLTSEGHSKLLDFGLAAAVDSGITVEPNLYESVGIEGSAATASVWLAGTPLYLSPELLEGGGAGPAQDTWALSLVLYESIAGCNPFRGQTLRTTVDNIRRCVLPDIRHYAPNAPPAVAAFLRCTLTRRSDRLRDASEIRSHIEQLLSVVKETL